MASDIFFSYSNGFVLDIPYWENIYGLEGLERRLWRYSLDLRPSYATYLVCDLKWTSSVISLVLLSVEAWCSLVMLTLHGMRLKWVIPVTKTLLWPNIRQATQTSFDSVVPLGSVLNHFSPIIARIPLCQRNENPPPLRCDQVPCVPPPIFNHPSLPAFSTNSIKLV